MSDRVRRVDVDPGRLGPSTYVVDENGCFIWQHAMANKTPIVFRDHHAVSVRRLLLPGIKPNEIVRMTCKNVSCVNPAHFRVVAVGRTYIRGAPTGRGLLDEHGRPRERSYDVNERGCHIWRGFTSVTGGPEAVFRGERVRVRSLLRGHQTGESVVIKSTCDDKRCINPKHLYEPGMLSDFKLARFREAKIKTNLARGPDELRELRWIRADLRRMLALDPKNQAGLGANARWAVEYYAEGWTLQQLADVADITRQALSQQIKLADRRLRRYCAQALLQ